MAALTSVAPYSLACSNRSKMCTARGIIDFLGCHRVNFSGHAIGWQTLFPLFLIEAVRVAAYSLVLAT